MRPLRTTVIAMAVLAPLLIAGCGPASSGAPATGKLDRSATLRIATPSALVPWDPTQSGLQSTSNMYYPLVYDQLLTLSADGKPAPMLATDYKLADDGLSMTLNLRDDVQFQSGPTVDADAVVANLKRSKNQSKSLLAGLLANVAEVKATSTHAVEIDFTAPTYGFPSLLAEDARISSVIDPRHLDDPSLTTTPFGSGPYTLAKQTSTSAAFDRVEHHWDSSSGLAAHIAMQVVTDGSARMNAIRSGQADAIVISGGQAAEAQRVADSSGGKIKLNIFKKSASVLELFPNPHKKLSDPKVRRAISLAVDRSAVCEVGYGSTASPTQQLFPPGVPGWVKELDDTSELAQDQNRAKELMSEAGVSNLSLEVMIPQFPELITMFQAFQQELEPIGITLTPNVQAGSAQVGALFAGGTGDVMWASSSSSFDSAGVITKNVASGKGFGVPDYAKSQVTKAEQVPPGPDAIAAFEQISRTLVEQPYTIPVCVQLSAQVVSGRVVGLDNMAYPLLAPGISPRVLGLSS